MDILIADDSKVDREFILKELSHIEDLKVKFADSGKNAIQCAHDDLYDFIILDYALGDMTALDVMNAVRKINFHRDTTILCVSGQTNSDKQKNILKKGASEYFAKNNIKGNLGKYIQNKHNVNLGLLNAKILVVNDSKFEIALTQNYLENVT